MMKKSIIAIVLLSVLTIVSCSDDYFTDGGLLDANINQYDGSTLNYLKSHPESFDTLATLITLCDLEDDVNKNGNTFFAPRDYSIHNYFNLVFEEKSKWPKTLSDIPQENLEEIKEILKKYIIPTKSIIRSELSTAYSYSQASGGQKVRFNLVREDYIGNVNRGAAYIMFGLDQSNGIGKENYRSVKVVNTELKSTNGIIHILDSDTHILGFN